METRQTLPKRSHLAGLLVLGTALSLGYTACAPATTVRAAVKDDKDRKGAPDFVLKDAEGKAVRLSDFRGKVVLLDFWATWCGPCQVEIPWFIEFQRKHKSDGLEVIGVSMDDDGWASVKPFLAEKHVNYRVLIGDEKTGDQYGGVEALPTTFLIDRAGRIASVHVGLAGKKDFEDAIETLLKDPAAGSPADNGTKRAE